MNVFKYVFVVCRLTFRQKAESFRIVLGQCIKYNEKLFSLHTNESLLFLLLNDLWHLERLLLLDHVVLDAGRRVVGGYEPNYR